MPDSSPSSPQTSIARLGDGANIDPRAAALGAPLGVFDFRLLLYLAEIRGLAADLGEHYSRPLPISIWQASWT